ncbi:MAG: acyl-CoA desaturase [Bacteroidetes bacterium]|nr:MAG: acyl-CoA desaturase [Bacteroidota bacterium]
MQQKKVKYSTEISSEFMQTAKARVRAYFKDNNITRYGNFQMYLKTVVMMSLYLTPYILMMSGVFSNAWLILGMYVIMGVGMAGVGFSVMHDANHGAYSKNKTLNKYLGLIINILGGNALNWKIQHNVLHHTYTNVDGLDEDIKTVNILRFSPHQNHYKIHKFQHLYAWFFYGLMTLMWVSTKDFSQLKRYRSKGLVKQFTSSQMGFLYFKIIMSKIVYLGLLVVLPMLVLPISIWLTLAFFFIMHFVAGLILAMVFQPAHVMPTSDFPLPNKNGIIENNWAIHQMFTTTNFAPNNKLLSWFIGGLNYQIEHHLFPNICHIHYSKINKIVKKTALEYGLPYNSIKSFRAALLTHARMLKKLGSKKDLGWQSELRID